MNNEELDQVPQEAAQEAPQEAQECAEKEAEAPAEAPAEATAEAAPKKAKSNVERWHAVTSDGLVSASTKNQLKARLKTLPAAHIESIIRGKKCSLQTAVSF